MSPMEFLAHIIMGVRHELGMAANDTLELVLSYPQVWTNAARSLLHRAAQDLAGATVHTMQPEPVAIALAIFKKDPSIKNNLLVIFDIGGGTTDLSAVLRTTNKDGVMSFSVLAAGGNRFLGGHQVASDLTERVLVAAREAYKDNDQALRDLDQCFVQQQVHQKCNLAKETLNDTE